MKNAREKYMFLLTTAITNCPDHKDLILDIIGDVAELSTLHENGVGLIEDSYDPENICNACEGTGIISREGKEYGCKNCKEYDL